MKSEDVQYSQLILSGTTLRSASQIRSLSTAGSGNALKSIREELPGILALDPLWRFLAEENRITTARAAEE